MVKVTSMMHFFSLSFKEEESALFPNANPKAPNNIDLPAPVSPVIIEKLSEKFIFNFSIKAKFSIEREVIMDGVF